MQAQAAKLGVGYAADADELRRKIVCAPASSFRCCCGNESLAQARCLSPAWDEQQFAHRRIYEKPVSGGVSVYCKDRDGRGAARAFAGTARRFGWRGVAMVE